MIEDSVARDALRGFLERLLGWGDAPAVDRALQAVELGAARRAPLVLCGDEDLVPVAHALHRRVLGAGRPFVVADPRRKDAPASARGPATYASGVAAFGAATDGSLCVRNARLPRDFARAAELLRDERARVRFVVCGATYDERDVLLAVADPVRVPALEDRATELLRVVEEYAADAAAALSSTVALTPRDLEWVVARCASSLHEVEVATLRLVALRQAGSVAGAAELLGMTATLRIVAIRMSRNRTNAAERLGMAPVSLTRWLGRRKVPNVADGGAWPDAGR